MTVAVEATARSADVRTSVRPPPLGELFTCPFCLGQWSATGFVASWLFFPRATRAVASVFAVRALSDWLQLGFVGLERLARGDDR